MSITFFAADADAFDSRFESLEFNTSSAMAAHLTVMLGLDTDEEIQARRLVAGEVPAARMREALTTYLAAHEDNEHAYSLSRLANLAEEAERVGSTIAWS